MVSIYIPGSFAMAKKTKRQNTTKVMERTQRPKRYKVIMFNDDYTPMEFVVMVLEHIFNQSPAQATRVMLTVHRQGSGIAGVYSKEIAETKAGKVIAFARQNGHPLKATFEKE